MCYRKQFFALLIICIAFVQHVKAQKTAGIFYFTITIDEEIVTLDKKTRKEGGILAGESLSIAIPEAMVDSMKRMTEKALSEKLDAEVQCVYVTTKKGVPFKTSGLESSEKMSVEGLPFATFKKAQEQFKKDLYLQILVTIEDGKGIHVDLGGKYRKIKPMITMKVKAFDSDKKEVWKYDAEIKNLAKLKRWKEECETWEHSGGEIMTAEVILAMYANMIDVFAQGREAD